MDCSYTYYKIFSRRKTYCEDDGSDYDYVASLIRNVLRVVDALPAFYIVGLVVILVSDEGQRVGDIAASTAVVEERIG